VVRADGNGKPRQVTHLNWVSGYPAWSPDATQVGFQSNVAPDHQRNEIYTIPAGGGTSKRMTYSQTDAIQPAWTPDGALAYSLDGAIWKQKDGKVTKLTSGNENDSAPAWNPKPPK
jgi:Tol biopolymer transport system component